MCIVAREVKEEAELIRFVRSPDGVAVPDLARKLPGRGVWVSLDRKILAESVRKKLFSRGFAAETTIPPDLPDMVSKMLRQQALSLLSLAKKAGEAVAGFMKVEEMLGRGRQSCCFMERTPHQTVAGNWTSWQSQASRRSFFSKPVNWIWHLDAQMWYMLPWLREGLPRSSPQPCAGSRRLRAFRGPPRT